MDLARKVIDATGSKSEVVKKPLPKDDPRRRRPDITLARELLSWQPSVPLGEGLRRTVDYFRELIGA
jgi:nucleoside-diphosphate-sugar epimerase